MTAVSRHLAPSYHSGDGTALVLLHGLTLSWRSWQPVIPLLTGRHQVFAPSLAGHHGAGPVAADAMLSVRGLADVLEAQLDEARIPTAHIAGNSLGGWIALELARRGRARSVVAFSPAGGWRTDRDLRRVARMVRVGQAFAHHPLLTVMLRRPGLRRAILRGACEQGDRISSAVAAEFFDDNTACTAQRELLASMKRDGPLEPLTDPGCPVRIAWAQHDRAIPFNRYGQTLAQIVPAAELVSLPGVGHVPMHDNPQLVADTILAVTSEVDDAAVEAHDGASDSSRSRKNALHHLLSRWRDLTDERLPPRRRAPTNVDPHAAA
jgi:pimeloyl-ACP methyl ester carboxylesterase